MDDDFETGGPTEAEQAIEDFLAEHPYGSQSFKENMATYEALQAEAYPEQAEAEPAPVTYPEGSEAASLAASPGGAELIRDWGGHENPDFAANVRIAKQEAAYIEQHEPELAAWAMQQHEEGSDLLRNPAVIRFLVRRGRERLYGDTAPPEPANSPPQTQQSTKPITTAGKEAAVERLEELYGLIGTDKYKSKRVQDEITALEAQLGGDEPVVGSGGRYV